MTLAAVYCVWQKPQKLRHMLSLHGEVTRIYLAPEGERGLSLWVSSRCTSSPASLMTVPGRLAFSSRMTALSHMPDPSVRKRRKKLGGNSGKNFSEGWVEFEDKRMAKAVAAQLNGNPMGGKRRSAYHYDLWCLKYLSKFKWDHLTEEIGARMGLCGQ